MRLQIFFILCLHAYSIISQEMQQKVPMFFCTAASEEFFKPLCNLIGSIHNSNFDQTEQIAVFNLGLTDEQITLLKQMAKVAVYEIEYVNPEILTQFKTRLNEEKYARGLYSWKPVVMKQSLDKFPYVLYLDAGTTVFKPLDHVFKQIKTKGYFFTTCGSSIFIMTTRYIINKFELLNPKNIWILSSETCGLRAGSQGVSRALYHSYILPMYNLAKDLRNFVDDGTSPYGFGGARHDQPLFSIYARLLGLTIFENYFVIDGQELHVTDQTKHINEKTVFAHTRQDEKFFSYLTCIRML